MNNTFDMDDFMQALESTSTQSDAVDSFETCKESADSEDNHNFLVLGLDDEEETGVSDFVLDSGFEEPEPVYRSVSTMMFQDHEFDPVYRSLKVSESCPPVFPGQGLDFDFQPSLAGGCGFNQARDVLASPKSLSTPRSSEGVDIIQMTRPLSSYQPSPVYAYSHVTSGKYLVDRIFQVLDKVEIDCKKFDNNLSCIPCKVVLGNVAYVFDIYVLELLDECKDETRGNFILEIQRTSSSGSAATWADLMEQVMTDIGDICFGGVYECAPKRESAKLARSKSISNCPLLVDLEDDSDFIPFEVDADVLVKEHECMVAGACRASTSWEQRVNMAQLLATLSESKESARIFIENGAVQKIINVLQSEELVGERNAYVVALCTTLANLAVHIDDVSTTIPSDLGAHTTMHILRSGDMEDSFDLGLMREAAKALACFSKHAKSKYPLRDQVREIATRCARSEDTRLCFSAHTVLRNLGTA
uniref:Uncharacterized protein n=1 Tax=Mucochytrium quahogii TaxID=96639 RepID=A0A7S2R834_9STRA|mmetsp:Transcript_19950/g.32878  ORF Transcript_19950/g.32878 Transcript_19950/m.32878 type:complete len:475 (-) Transcript_19950:66-1490(-)|eukprot:CAMPEP_0203746202 /NCGR_PEP_ID=MMETSP0098-20131031/1707_1 /ASSEMBLY_ACC=CAM_ASM_000208 /TAXON_ID=96639 /ORGANISM=" , Strain NY0313808BC1" /LENGTH=474 /DNA_ID=CAMNT_0050634207 /DNA_START=193 /DNA_END=1617 /DNA_ORIENTATION=+